MEVWVPWDETELLVELPSEALVDLLDPAEPDPTSLRRDPMLDREPSVAVIDVTFSSPSSVGDLIGRLPSETIYAVSWVDLDSPHSGAGVLRAVEERGAIPVSGGSDLGALRERLLGVGEVLLVVPAVNSVFHSLDDLSLADAFFKAIEVPPGSLKVQVLRYVLDARGDFLGFIEQRTPAQRPDRRYDLVVCSPGGRPFDRTFVGSLMVALSFSDLADDGRVLGLVCGCGEGFGSSRALERMVVEGQDVAGDTYSLLASRFRGERSRVRLLTNAPLPRAIVQDLLGLRQVQKVDDLVHAATRFVGREIRVAVIRRAALGFQQV